MHYGNIIYIREKGVENVSDVKRNSEWDLLDELYAKECREFEKELSPELVEKFYRLENLKEKLVLCEVQNK